MGPKKRDIPLKVEKEGNLVSNVEDVLNVWKNDFEQLYNPPAQPVDPELFFVNNEKTHLEITLNNTQNTKMSLILLLFVEVRRSILLSKKNKTPGVDLIPNEVIKNPKICKVLFTLFNFCFQNHIVLNLWLKSIVKPIPKSPEKSLYVPMNYRGISLISCIAKIYSSILNSRVSAYLEDSKILVEEQNGFRKTTYLYYLQL